MNTYGMIISFFIGGLLLVSILTMNATVSKNSGETVLNMTAKSTVDNITQFMRRDFVRLGYNLPAGVANTPIKVSTGNKIVFFADTDNNPTTPAAIISWEFTNQKFTASENKNDYKLIRTGPGGKTVFPVIYKNPGKPNFKYVKNPKGNIQSIRVRVWTASAQKYSTGSYQLSHWEKTFSPPPLNFQNINLN